MKLTKAVVAKLQLPDNKSDVIFFDDALPCFGLRIRAGGKRSWVVQYASGSAQQRKQRRLSLGSIEVLDLDQARQKAREALASVVTGGDPQAEKIAARTPKPVELTLGEAVDKFLPVAARKVKASTYYQINLHLKTHWKPLHHYELRAVERRHIAAELGRIAEASGPIGANRSRAALSSFFAWCVGEGFCDANAVIGTNKPLKTELARDRVLSADELRLIWLECGKGEYAAIIKLLILTGQRRAEVGGMLWSELDLEAALWRIGPQRTKNRRPHEVPLSASAVALIRGLYKRADRDFVFGSGDGSFAAWSQSKDRIDARILARLRKSDPAATLTPWRVHDLRRTTATGMADIGILPHVVETVLNHVSGHKGGVAGIYNRSNYGPEKRAALNLWDVRLAKLVEGRE
jgi:integrase